MSKFAGRLTHVCHLATSMRIVKSRIGVCTSPSVKAVRLERVVKVFCVDGVFL